MVYRLTPPPVEQQKQKGGFLHFLGPDCACSLSLFFFFFFFFVVNFVIHWNEKALGSHVFHIPIPPPTSLPTRSLQVLPEHQVPALVSCIILCFERLSNSSYRKKHQHMAPVKPCDIWFHLDSAIMESAFSSWQAHTSITRRMSPLLSRILVYYEGSAMMVFG